MQSVNKKTDIIQLGRKSKIFTPTLQSSLMSHGVKKKLW